MVFRKLSCPFVLSLLLALPAAAQEPGGEAMVKLLGLLAGDPQPVTFSETEVNALLESPILAPSLATQAGLTGLRVGFHPGEVHVTGHLDPARLGPLAGGGAAPRPVELAFEVSGTGGVGVVSLRRSVIAGLELPPEVVEDALVPMLLAPFQEANVEAPASGEPFPLPHHLQSVEVLDGTLSLRANPR